MRPHGGWPDEPCAERKTIRPLPQWGSTQIGNLACADALSLFCAYSILRKRRLFYAQKKAILRIAQDCLFGASGRIRTGDLVITNQLLYLLSHTSIRYNIVAYNRTFCNRICNSFFQMRIFFCCFLLGCLHRCLGFLDGQRADDDHHDHHE